MFILRNQRRFSDYCHDSFSNAKDTSDTSWLSLPHATSPPVPQLNVTSAASPSSLGAQSAQAAPSPIAALENRIEILSKHNETLTLEISRGECLDSISCFTLHPTNEVIY